MLPDHGLPSLSIAIPMSRNGCVWSPNPASPLTLKVNERKVVQIVYSPSNATDPSFHVDKPDGTAAFDIHCPFEGSKEKFQIIAMQAGKGVVNITEVSGLSATMEVTVTQ